MPLNLKAPLAIKTDPLEKPDKATESLKALINDWGPTLNRYSLNLENSLAATHKIASNAPNVAANVVATSGGGVKSVALTEPPEFAVSGSPGTGVVKLGVTWNPVQPGTILEGPIPGLQGYDRTYIGANESGVGAFPLTITGSDGPAATTEWAFATTIVQSSHFASAIPSGWTDILGQSTTSRQFLAQLVPPVGTGALTQTTVGLGSAAGVECYFGGPIPTFIQQAHVSDGGVGTTTLTITGLTSNSTLLVVTDSILGTIPPAFTAYWPGFPVNLTNDQGKTVFNLGKASIPGAFTVGSGAQKTVHLIPFVNSGTMNIKFIGLANVGATVIYAIECTPFSAVPATPRFNQPGPEDLSYTINVLALSAGGTSADLSQTGGTGQVLMQENGAGYPINVRRLTASDLSNGNIGSGNIILASLGTYRPAGSGVNFSSNSADIGLTSIITVPAAGLFRLSWTMYISQAATTSSSLPDIKFTWSDQDTAVTETSPLFTAPTPTGNTTTTGFSGSYVVSAFAGNAINYQVGNTTHYASVGATPMQYSLHIRLEYIGS